ncbi:MAG TPA: M4 family metallopeptidase [Thermoanaerobaculia bacterium]|nr:M4 family metallopeptidase [Thermoanaerobaculia bacterium]
MRQRCFRGIVPPHMLIAICQNGTTEERGRALRTLVLSERLRERRVVLSLLPGAAPVGQKRRVVYDAKHKTTLPGTLVRSEGDPPKKDAAVNEAYDGAGSTYDLYWKVYQRNSIDGRGMRLDSSVHYAVGYDNAFWNGNQMVYGDGDGKLFNRFTISVDVIGHELTHGVTAHEANLDYKDQPGALNESFSDVFGSLVKQRTLKQTADKADWLIGAGLFTPKVQGVALRSMRAPGTAYDDPVLGKDPQPADMKGYVTTTEDDGGVHINSGIPNRAFYLTAAALGGFAWEKAGKIWYTALTKLLRKDSDFGAAARLTRTAASDIYGKGSAEEKAVQGAWRGVGVEETTTLA